MLLNTNGISVWWNGLEWQEYKTPDPADLLLCNNPDDAIKEGICYIDHVAYQMADIFPGEWFYKMVANAGMHARMGIDKEWEHLLWVIQNW